MTDTEIHLKVQATKSRNRFHGITITLGPAGPVRMACSCKGGRYSRYTCAHVEKIAAGDLSDVLDRETLDVAQLQKLLRRAPWWKEAAELLQLSSGDRSAHSDRIRDLRESIAAEMSGHEAPPDWYSYPAPVSLSRRAQPATQPPVTPAPRGNIVMRFNGVQGTDGRPYTVTLTADSDRGTNMRLTCSCPKGSQDDVVCSHRRQIGMGYISDIPDTSSIDAPLLTRLLPHAPWWDDLAELNQTDYYGSGRSEQVKQLRAKVAAAMNGSATPAANAMSGDSAPAVPANTGGFWRWLRGLF